MPFPATEGLDRLACVRAVRGYQDARYATNKPETETPRNRVDLRTMPHNCGEKMTPAIEIDHEAVAKGASEDQANRIFSVASLAVCKT